MTVSIPLVVIVGAVVYLAWRYMGLRVWQAVVCLIVRIPARGDDRRAVNPQPHHWRRPVVVQTMTTVPTQRGDA